MRGDLQQRYLRVLGLEALPPSLPALRELVAAQMCRIPFENVSKIHYLATRGLREMPDLELYLEGAERHGFGGTCYSSNDHFCELLKSLGYEARLCGADMNRPEVHLTIRVRLDDAEYLLDAGYAAPFTEPLPLDAAEPIEITFGEDLYRLQPRGADGSSRLEMLRGGQPRHGYRVRPTAREIGHFDGTVRDSFRPEAAFLNSLLLARYCPEHWLRVHNLTVVDGVGVSAKLRNLSDRAALVEFIVKEFAMPRDIVAGVVESLPELGNPWGSSFP